MKSVHILVTCEHAGNQVPEAYQYLFDQDKGVLQTHRGIDIGALQMAQTLSLELGTKLYETSVTRLLIDCNRSMDNWELFSEYSQPLKKSVKTYLLEKYYIPYRSKVEAYLANHTKKQTVLHLSIHSFTPIWHGKPRSVDIGLLFDESREQEKALCHSWQDKLQAQLDDKLVMLNLPYNGADDGFTTYLRTKFPIDKYMGIELEINQKWANTDELNTMLMSLVSTLLDSLASMNAGEVVRS